MMGASSGLLMLLVCFVNVKLTHSEAQLIYQYTPYYNQKWSDAGSGAKQDVSVWTAIPFRSGFFPVGDTAVLGHSKPKSRAIIVKDTGIGFVKRPLDFKKIWSDVGSGSKKDVTFYKMIPPTGYVCLGHVAVPSHTTKPDPNAYRCVKSDLAMNGSMYPIWNDKGSGSKEDVSLWSVENDPTHPLGMLALTFISTIGHSRPTERAYVLNSNKVTLSGFNNGSEVAIMLYQTSDMTSVWDDKGSGSKKEVSIWKANYCCSLGYVAVGKYLATFAVHAKAVVKGALEKPKGFASVWNDKGSQATRDCSIWRPLCPAKYIALGYAAMTSLTAQPSTEEFRCVHMDYVTPGVWEFVWDDKGSGANVDMSIWQANQINASGQGVYAMSAVNRHGKMATPAYVLKSVNVRIQTNKPAKKFVIFDLVYNFDDREILQAEPIKLGARTIVENCKSKPGSPSLVVTRAITFRIEEEHSWNVKTSIEVGITTQVKAGIPGIADVSTSGSVTTSFTSGVAGKTSKTTSDSISAAMEARPGTSVGYIVMGKKYVMNIPWTGKLKTTFIDDSTQVENVSGKYYGTQIAEYRVTAEAPIECSKTA